MKKITKIAALTLALSFPLINVNTSSPSIAYASNIQRIDLGVDTSNAAFREDALKLNQTAAIKEEALKQVREIRGRLWDENIPYTLNETSNSKNEKLQDVAKAHGLSTRDAYVNAVSWSQDLERIAIQRAYEQTITGLDHDRPDGRDNDTAITKSGVRANGEILASSTLAQDPARSFNQWSFATSKYRNNKSEYDILKENNGVSNNDNGHLFIILNPEFRYMGYAFINGTNDKWNYGVAEFAIKNPNNNTNPTGYVGGYRLYIGNPPAESSKPAPTKEASSLTAESRAKLEKALADAKTQINSAEFLLQYTPKTVAGVKDKLTGLVAQSKALIERAEAILNK